MITNIASATVLSCFVSRVTNAVEALNKRAKRLRAAPYDLVVGEPYIRTKTKTVRPGTHGAKCMSGEWRIEIREEVVDVSVMGVPVKADGWIFVAKLDFLSDDASGVVISKAPGWESLSIERPDANRCDHCQKNRRRAVCYVVQNDVGARKVVGSSCLTDFTGMGRNVERLVELGFVAASLLADADGWGDEGGGSRSRATELVEYLTAVAAVIRAYGWMSRGKARERGEDRASADVASGWLASTREDRIKHFEEIGPKASRADRAVALRSAHWCESIDAKSDYEENIRAIATSGYALPKHTGLAASIVAAWLRHREQLVAQASRPRANADAVCGTLGKRGVFSVLVAGARCYENDFGVRTRVSLVDTETGAEIIWWCSGTCPEEIWEATKPRPANEAARVLTIAATVKKHDVYNGRRQTVVSRLAMAKAKAKAPKKPRTKKAGKAKPAAADDNGHPATGDSCVTEVASC